MIDILCKFKVYVLIRYISMLQYDYHCSVSSAFLLTLVISCLLHDSHSNRCEVMSHCGFDLCFPDD